MFLLPAPHFLQNNIYLTDIVELRVSQTACNQLYFTVHENISVFLVAFSSKFQSDFSKR